jgi:pentapeptide MXKDX repeat protein
MKWMISGAVMVAVALSVGVRAQSGSGMAQDDKMGKMDKMEKMDGKTPTYTGCLAAGAEAGTFTLTHASADDHMGKDAMKHDAMKGDAMKNDAMKNDTLAVSSKNVDLGKHVGHKVTVTGSSVADKMDANGKSTSAFTVTSLKMVSASCS